MQYLKTKKSITYDVIKPVKILVNKRKVNADIKACAM
jgi:hypothetical protein